MKKTNSIKLLFALFVLWSVFAISGCKKEPIVKQISTVTVFDQDSAIFLKGYLGDELVKFEGNGISYNAYVNPDSNSQQHGHGQDYAAYYMSGSKWVTLSGSGISATNASVEIRSLAVRVFVTPIAATSSTYYNLLGPATYQFADGDNTSAGAYVSMRDKNGLLWTSLGDQDGSTLTVTTMGANMVTYTIVAGTISCNMYDPSGHMKQLTGAKFTAALGL